MCLIPKLVFKKKKKLKNSIRDQNTGPLGMHELPMLEEMGFLFCFFFWFLGHFFLMELSMLFLQAHVFTLTSQILCIIILADTLNNMFPSPRLSLLD